MHHTLQLAGTLDVADVVRVMNVLRALPGVDGVEATAGSPAVAVSFDQQRTSIQELGATVARAGYPQQASRHASGGCCGGCGGA